MPELTDWPDEIDKPPRKRSRKSRDKPAPPATIADANKVFNPMRPNLTLAKRFKSIGIEKADAWDMARMCAYTNPNMAKVVAEYDKHTNPDHMNFENFCEMADVPPFEFYGQIQALHAELHISDAVSLAKGALPRIVQRVIECADDPDNYQDRNLALKIGSMPGMQNGPGINITNTINASQNNFIAQGVPRFNSDTDDDSTREILEATLPAQLPAAREEYIDGIVIEEREKQNG